MPRPKGFVMDQSQRDNIQAAQLASWRRRMKPADQIDYASLHRWLRRTYPKTGVCEECGGEPTDGTEFSLAPGRAYSRDRGDYNELCRSCHRRRDHPKRRRSP